MASYLSTIHKRSDTHKRRFALGVSASVTLVIFLIWSLTTFNNPAPTVADTNTLQPVQLAGAAAALPDANGANPLEQPETPFDAIKGGVQNIVDAVKQGVGQTKTTLQSVDVNQQYQDVRNQALPTTTNGN